jgi:hypothetical protein
MSPPEEHHLERHLYREQIGAFVLGELEGGELEAMRAHLDGCPVCRAEVSELEPVVAALADADPDRIDEYPRPPGDLEESTFAPISGEIRRARDRGRRFGWSGLAAAAIFAVVIGLAGFAWLVEPAVALVEPLAFARAPGVKVEGHLIAHASGTEIRLVVFSGARDGQTYRVTLVSKDGKRVNAGTFIGAGDEPVRGTFHAALLRKDAAKLEVGTPGGEPAFFSELPEKPRDKVREWPLLGILPWAEPHPHNKTMEPGAPKGKKGPSAKDTAPATAPADTPETPKAPSYGGGGSPPPKENPPESGGKSSPSPGGEKPGAEPEGSEPSRGPAPPAPSASPAPSDSCALPPDQQPPACGQYDPRS